VEFTPAASPNQEAARLRQKLATNAPMRPTQNSAWLHQKIGFEAAGFDVIDAF
jgi:hypothetical protein